MTAQPNQVGATIPNARIEAVEIGSRRKFNGIGCVIGRDIVIKPDVLAEYCFHRLTSKIEDLVLIAGIVAFTDRVVTRHASTAWRRQLEVVIPVHQPDFWKQHKVVNTLTAVLELLTGDTWTFVFRKRLTPTLSAPQNRLPFNQKPVIVLPYSDGLDSLAGSRLVSAQEPNATLILVTTGSRNDADSAVREKYLNARRCRVAVPFRLSHTESEYRFREPSFRSRAFAYGVMAGIAAHLARANRVIVSESGQGALGPWLVPVGNETPDIRMHPLFTRRLSNLLKIVFGSDIHYEHPNLWATKGETLRELRELGLAEGWQTTRSCARDARHMTLHGKLIQCGVCAACLLRRQSLFAAGFNGDQPYLWQNLNAPRLEDAAKSGARATRPDDSRHAICGALALTQLASLADAEHSDAYLKNMGGELSRLTADSAAECEKKLKRLLQAHRNEWYSFLDAQGKASFLKSWVSGIQC